MSDLITLENIDADGAVREAEEAVAGDSRADFFRKGAIAGGSLIGGGVLLSGFPSIAGAVTPSKKNDVKILNYALTLEYLESTFYNTAVKNGIIKDDALKSVIKVVQAHENAHVAGLKKALGKSAIKKPKFDFGKAVTDEATFLATSVILEDTGVSAYAGQGPYIKQLKVAQTALAIHSVEARHASVLRYLAKAKGGFAPKALDPHLSMSQVTSPKRAGKFIKK